CDSFQKLDNHIITMLYSKQINVEECNVMSNPYFVCTLSLPEEGFAEAVDFLAEAKLRFLQENDERCLSEQVEFKQDGYTYIFTLLCNNLDDLQIYRDEVLNKAPRFDFEGDEEDYSHFFTNCEVQFNELY